MAILGVCAIMACHARRGVTMHCARAAACQCVPMHPGGSDPCAVRAPRAAATGIHYLHVRSIVSQNHGRPTVTIQIQEWVSDSCQQSLTQSACDSQLIQKYRRIPYSDCAAGGARARALAGQGREEGAHGGHQCRRAARNPMLSARHRIAGDLSYKDHPSLPTPDPCG